MKKIILIFNFSFFCLFSIFATTAFTPIRPKIISSRTSGYGGSYTAQEAGIDTLSTNPACLADVTGKWSVSRIDLRLSGPLFDLPVVLAAEDKTGALLNLVGENNGIYLGLDSTGPIAIARVEKNFGFGVFNRSLVSANIPGLSGANIVAGEEFLLTGGYGLEVFSKNAHALSAGIQLKGFFQTFLAQKGTAVSIMNTALNFNFDALPAVLSTGFGLDIGLLYNYQEWLSVGLTCKDAYTPVFTTKYASLKDYIKGNSIKTDFAVFDPLLNVGACFSIPLPARWITISSWDVLVDYRNALEIINPIYRNPILNVALGTEISFFDVVSLRAGIQDTYLSAGLGLDFKFFVLDVAMYGTELSLEPGKRSLLNIAAGFSVVL